MSKIKICGLFLEEDIAAVNLYRPDYVGFIINYPKSHRNIDIKSLEELSKKIDGSVKKVGVFVNEDMEFIKKLFDKGLFDIIQLHGDEDNEYIKNIRSLTKGYIIKAHKTENLSSIDTGKGSGISHSKESIELIKQIKREYMLAGGINDENIEYLLKELSPYAVDISGGAETNKRKDKDKIKKLIDIVRKEKYNE